MIINAILKLTWIIFIQGPLSLIAAFNTVLEYLTGGIINDLLFGSVTEFQWNNIPIQFWWFVVLAFCLFALIFVIQMIILIFKEAIETKTKFVIALQNAVKSFSFMFLIPIFFFLANFIVQNIANTVINHFGNNSNLANYLYNIGNPHWDGNPTISDGYGPPGNIRDYNIMAQLLGTWFMLFAILMIGLILVQKIIELFFLFVISPIVMVVMVIDDGKSAYTWKDMVIAKFLASTATLIGYYIFISATQGLLSSGLKGLDDSPITKSLFIILFLCGGAMATMSFSDMTANFLGEAVGFKEGMASMRSTVAGGMMAMGAGKMAGRALGFMKSQRAKSGIIDGLANSLTNDGKTSDVGGGVNMTTFRNATIGMAARSGIIGLTGLVTGAIGAGYGHMAGGAEKAWKTNSRKGLMGKVRGTARIVGQAAITPVVAPSKKIYTGFKNTGKIIKNSATDAKQKKLIKHKNSLKNQEPQDNNKN
ncbi:MAG: hypothetical protein REH79_02270 [Spiroplasma sp.]|nr:hypothetical protein [Spiroplasma sp.]